MKTTDPVRERILVECRELGLANRHTDLLLNDMDPDVALQSLAELREHLRNKGSDESREPGQCCYVKDHKWRCDLVADHDGSHAMRASNGDWIQLP